MELRRQLKTLNLFLLLPSHDWKTEQISMRIQHSANSTFHKLSNPSFLGHSFQKFVEIVEHFKLEGKLKLKMDELFEEVVLVQRNFNTIKSSELFISSKTTSR